MTQEQQNLIELLTSPDKANVLMGLRIFGESDEKNEWDACLTKEGEDMKWEDIETLVNEIEAAKVFYIAKMVSLVGYWGWDDIIVFSCVDGKRGTCIWELFINWKKGENEI